jgi:mRNA-degrading endonuclease RelE of RelBE toxin-antitoxin system
VKVVRSPRFDRAYKKLPPEVQSQFKEKLELLVESKFTHPSLRIKRIKGTERIREASITMEYRFTFEKIEDGILLRVIGTHDILKRP